MTSLGVNSVFYQWFIQTLCVGHYTNLISAWFVNGTVNKIRHYVLAVLLGLFRERSITNQLINAGTMS